MNSAKLNFLFLRQCQKIMKNKCPKLFVIKIYTLNCGLFNQFNLYTIEIKNIYWRVFRYELVSVYSRFEDVGIINFKIILIACRILSLKSLLCYGCEQL